MTAPATNVRLQVVRWIVDHLRDRLPEAKVSPGWTETDLGRNSVWVDEVTGDITMPVMVSGRRHRDDKFAVPLVLQVVRATLDDALDALNELIAGVEDVLADAHTLDDDIAGILSAEVSDEASVCIRGPNDARGFARIEIAVHARLA